MYDRVRNWPFCILYFSVQLPGDLYMDKLELSDTEIVCSVWKYNTGKETVIWTKFIIENMPCSCVRDNRGCCLARALTNNDGSVGQIHTLPDYRRQGLAHAAWSDVSQRLANQGFNAYSFIEIDNVASLNLFRKSNLCREMTGTVVFARL